MFKNVSSRTRNWLKEFHAPHWYVLIRSYFSSRPYSFGLLVFSIIISFLGVIVVYRIYTPDSPKTYIYVVNLSSNGIIVTNAQLYISYNEKGKQSLDLSLSVVGEQGKLQGKTLPIRVSTNLRRVPKYGLGPKVKYENYGNDYHYFTFLTADKEMGIMEHFEGDIFGSNKSQLALNISFEVEHIPSPLPLGIIISDLSGLNITNSYPEADETSPFAIVYKNRLLDQSEPQANSFNIIVTGFDSLGVNMSQLVIFMGGLGLGVFLSLSTTILYDVVRFSDDAKPNDKSHKTIRYKKNFSGSLKFTRRPMLSNKSQPKRKTLKPKKLAK